MGWFDKCKSIKIAMIKCTRNVLLNIAFCMTLTCNASTFKFAKKSEKWISTINALKKTVKRIWMIKSHILCVKRQLHNGVISSNWHLPSVWILLNGSNGNSDNNKTECEKNCWDLHKRQSNSSAKKIFFLERWLVFISFSTCFVVSLVIMCVLFLIFCRFFHSTVQLLVQLVKLCVINCICLLWLNSCDFVAKRESFFLSYTELYLWLVLWVIYSVLRHPPSP